MTQSTMALDARLVDPAVGCERGAASADATDAEETERAAAAAAVANALKAEDLQQAASEAAGTTKSRSSEDGLGLRKRKGPRKRALAKRSLSWHDTWQSFAGQVERAWALTWDGCPDNLAVVESGGSTGSRSAQSRAHTLWRTGWDLLSETASKMGDDLAKADFLSEAERLSQQTGAVMRRSVSDVSTLTEQRLQQLKPRLEEARQSISTAASDAAAAVAQASVVEKAAELAEQLQPKIDEMRDSAASSAATFVADAASAREKVRTRSAELAEQVQPAVQEVTDLARTSLSNVGSEVAVAANEVVAAASQLVSELPQAMQLEEVSELASRRLTLVAESAADWIVHAKTPEYIGGTPAGLWGDTAYYSSDDENAPHPGAQKAIRASEDGRRPAASPAESAGKAEDDDDGEEEASDAEVEAAEAASASRPALEMIDDGDEEDAEFVMPPPSPQLSELASLTPCSSSGDLSPMATKHSISSLETAEGFVLVE
eukprot:TRINITY_DN45046_c0_g1_i1.p1 TRINITY_DN45046_c0_g1~~TRINITY_DN45046_c0_g1_i1.p1  ORF type:complete len:489 (-),score=161.02 TRINITY_DN45046_c0_g1_i1:168-1634(-)